MDKNTNFIFVTTQMKKILLKKIAQTPSKKLFWIYVNRHSTEKCRDIMGIFYTLFSDARNDGPHGTAVEPQDWLMAQMQINYD